MFFTPFSFPALGGLVQVRHLIMSLIIFFMFTVIRLSQIQTLTVGYLSSLTPRRDLDLGSISPTTAGTLSPRGTHTDGACGAIIGSALGSSMPPGREMQEMH